MESRMSKLGIAGVGLLAAALGAGGCSLPSGNKTSCNVATDCNAGSECMQGQCIARAITTPTGSALDALCAAHDGPIVKVADGNASYLAMVGNWVICGGSLGPADAVGAQFTPDGHINLMRADGQGDLTPATGFDYQGTWGWVRDWGNRFVVGNLTLLTPEFEATPHKMQVETYAQSDQPFMPVVLAYASPIALGCDGPDGITGTLSDLVPFPDEQTAAAYFHPYVVGRYRLCAGTSIVVSASATPAGFELADDDSAYVLVDDGHGNLVRGDSLGTWVVDAEPATQDQLVAIPRLTFTQPDGPTVQQFAVTPLNNPNGLSFTQSGQTTSYRVIP
jgi:hypothetical protein